MIWMLICSSSALCRQPCSIPPFPPQVEAPLKAGPQRDLDAYLQQLSALQAAMQYLQEHDNLLAAQQAYGHAEQVGAFCI